MNKSLKPKVEAVNRANKYMNELAVKLVAFFGPLVGKEILKADGSLLAKYAKQLSEVVTFPNTVDLLVYRNPSRYTLSWVVKTCQPIEGECGCLYHEVTLYVGDLDGQTLKALLPFTPQKTDYSAEKVEALRGEVKKAKDKYENLKRGLFPFEE